MTANEAWMKRRKCYCDVKKPFGLLSFGTSGVNEVKPKKSYQRIAPTMVTVNNKVALTIRQLKNIAPLVMYCALSALLGVKEHETKNTFSVHNNYIWIDCVFMPQKTLRWYEGVRHCSQNNSMLK